MSTTAIDRRSSHPGAKKQAINAVSHPPSLLVELFQGRLREDLAYPFPELEGEEKETLEILIDSVEKFLALRVDPVAIDRDSKIPDDVLQEAREFGLFGLLVCFYSGSGPSREALGGVTLEGDANPEGWLDSAGSSTQNQ